MAHDDMKTLMKQIAEILPTLATKADVAKVQADFSRLEAKVDADIRVQNARLDEQRSILAALVPRRVAAIKPAAE